MQGQLFTECGHVLDSCGMSLIAVVIHGMWFSIVLYSRLLCGTDRFATWSASWRPGQQTVEMPKAIEEVIRERLFSSLFVVNIGQAKQSLKRHLFSDRTYSVIC